MDPWTPAWDYLWAGGPVMAPLVAVSLWLWALILRKTLWLMTMRRESINLTQALDSLAGQAPPPSGQSPRGAALTRFLAQRTGHQARDLRLWEAAVRHQAPAIWRHLAVITVLAAVAPLLGLLGTVTGMIETFNIIQTYGTGNAQGLSAGISEALITTQTGLLVAIPGLFAAHVLRRQAGKMQGELYLFQSGVERWLKESEARRCYV
ncbi:MAG: MotA/TolQ/ExbB proton channel family protein [Thermodesulfobacteriota bacterium]